MCVTEGSYGVVNLVAITCSSSQSSSRGKIDRKVLYHQVSVVAFLHPFPNPELTLFVLLFCA
jgi:hypothetical protein